MPLDTETRGIIESLLHDNKIVLFMKGTPQQPQCGFSATTVSTLDMLVPSYATVNVLEHPNIRDGIKEFGNWPTIPQLYVDGELLGGCDIITDMMRNGELPEALGVEQPPATSPTIHIGESGRKVIKNAIESQAGAAIHLQISAGWLHTLSLAQPNENAVKVKVDDLVICLDPWSAGRADGLRIELQEGLTGTSFSFDNPNAPPPVNQLAVQELQQKLSAGSGINLFDVRTPEEIARAVISGAVPWTPDAMRIIEALPKDAELIFYCHSGGRSQAVADQFRRQGYTNLHNLRGGIKAWSDEIDPALGL
jgi:monothiol glutaredoxin